MMSQRPARNARRPPQGAKPGTIGSAILLLLGMPSLALADNGTQPLAANIYSATSTPIRGERLSQWLQRQQLTSNTYLSGLSWLVPAEVPTQAAMHSALRAHLTGSEWTYRANIEARQRLLNWINSLSVTGRVPIAMADARWLETQPARNPVLAPDHQIVLAQRPTTVTVITSKGYLCVVPHAPGLDARSYIDACADPSDNRRIDRVWIAQPDGRTRDYGIASWNAQQQDEPAPGAWIWAPARGAGWADEFSQSLIAFLATQGPALDQGASNNVAAVRPSAVPRAPMPQAPLRDPSITANDWGGIGLLQTPTARMAPAGELSVGFSRTYPYSRINVTLQPFDWMELTYRYTSISGVFYGPQSLSGTQSYKDKGVDLKIRLLKESPLWPEIAIGGRDMVGTGLFSGEYVVANKRTGDFDWSLGLGWGSLGSRGSLGNPLSVISSKFNTRNINTNPGGGQLGLGSLFRGPTSLFGGVQMQTPWTPLILKLEYEGNDYKFNGQYAIVKPKSAFNFGAVYRYSPSVDLTFGVQRGNVATLGLAFHAPLAQLSTPKINDPVLPRFVPERTAVANWSASAPDLRAQTGWDVSEIQKHGTVLVVEFENADTVYWQEMVERATAVLHRDAPADVQEFHFIYKTRGITLASHVVNRERWVKTKNQPLLPSEARARIYPSVDFSSTALSSADLASAHTSSSATTAVTNRNDAPATKTAASSVSILRPKDYPRRATGDFGFAIKQSLGGPDGFILYQVSLEGNSEWQLTPNTWVSGGLNLRAFDNYRKFRYTADSKLPRVRTYVREFLTTSRVTMPNLQLTHIGQLSSNQYFSLYGGYLESMYAGVGGEWLYRPFAGPLALGIDMNAVKQRDFNQKFGLRDYRALTGHATAYIDTGWNDVQAKISVGQYLAKDRGVTLDLSRRFSNGVVFGAYATKTNVSSAQFGEGGFDKGIYFSIPLSAMFTRSTPDIATFMWNPLVRDGGAKLNRAYPLYEMTKIRGPRALTTLVPDNP